MVGIGISIRHWRVASANTCLERDDWPREKLLVSIDNLRHTTLTLS